MAIYLGGIKVSGGSSGGSGGITYIDNLSSINDNQISNYIQQTSDLSCINDNQISNYITRDEYTPGSSDTKTKIVVPDYTSSLCAIVSMTNGLQRNVTQNCYVVANIDVLGDAVTANDYAQIKIYNTKTPPSDVNQIGLGRTGVVAYMTSPSKKNGNLAVSFSGIVQSGNTIKMTGMNYSFSSSSCLMSLKVFKLKTITI